MTTVAAVLAVLVAVGAAGLAGWMLLNPGCPECGYRQPMAGRLLIAFVLGIVAAALVLT